MKCSWCNVTLFTLASVLHGLDDQVNMSDMIDTLNTDCEGTIWCWWIIILLIICAVEGIWVNDCDFWCGTDDADDDCGGGSDRDDDDDDDDDDDNDDDNDDDDDDDDDNDDDNNGDDDDNDDYNNILSI